ncbi:MAG: hypothetical protein ABW133_04085 [Polyangiaceae bacterium]
MCDETASSRVAPPPILPIRDVKLEAAHPCDKAPAERAPVAVTPVGPQVPSAPAVHQGGIANEAWMRPNELFIAPPNASIRRDGSSDSLPLAAGFSRSVFRPPRASA